MTGFASALQLTLALHPITNVTNSCAKIALMFVLTGWNRYAGSQRLVPSLRAPFLGKVICTAQVLPQNAIPDWETTLSLSAVALWTTSFTRLHSFR